MTSKPSETRGQTLREQIAQYLRHAEACEQAASGLFKDGEPRQLSHISEDGPWHPARCTCGLQQAADRLASLEQSWRCFHCGEVFTVWGAARDHFGAVEGVQAGCVIDRVAVEEGGKPERGRGLLMALRKAEAKLASLEQDRRTVASIAAMLGWENVPPRETLERNLSALKARLASLEQEQQEREARSGVLPDAKPVPDAHMERSAPDAPQWRK